MKDFKKEIEGFLKLLAGDPRLKEIVKKIDIELGKGKDSDTKIIEEKIIPIAKEKGFEFTSEEFLNYVEKLKDVLEDTDSSEEQPEKKSRFGGGKLGKLIALLGGGTAVGVGGVAAFKHFNKPKADIAQVQSVETKDQENKEQGNTENGEAVQNDGLRPDEAKDQSPGEQDQKTSEKLKEELQQHGNKDQGATTAPKAAKQDNRQAEPPAGAITKEQKIEIVNDMLDKIINNVDGALDKGIEEAKKQGQEVNKEEVIRMYKELKEKGTDEQKLQLYNMIVRQAMGGGGMK